MPRKAYLKHECLFFCMLMDEILGPNFRYTIELFVLREFGISENLGSLLLKNPRLVYMTLIRLMPFPETAYFVLKSVLHIIGREYDLEMDEDLVIHAMLRNDRLIVGKFLRELWLRGRKKLGLGDMMKSIA
ncbi:MAG: hypothetical protein J7L11_06555 [Thermoprotei archaeon]|nr:hypothetical protein [Thermoprotei archaeon]